MNTREIAEEYRLAHWAGIMKDRAASGQSIRSFCKAAGIHEHVYFYWQKKLREAAGRELAVASTKEATVPAGWSMCLPENTTKTAVGTVSVEVGPYKVNIAADTDLELLKKVMRVLVAQC